MQESLEEAILAQLAQPVRLKDGRTATDPDGNPLTPIRAAAMSLTQAAMKGDIPSLMLLRNMTARTSSADAEQHQQHQQELYEEARRQIIQELTAVDLYLGQDLEIEQLARNKVILSRLDALMQAPDYEDVLQTYDKSGHQSLTINPLHRERDQRQRQFLQDLQQLRSDAVRQKMMNRKK